ncbi:MAG: xanthine dehydrogenase small subunit [Sneathiella sp.]|nr:xanthine dehydrogenase small subunit [Sneathiella sp.]
MRNTVKFVHNGHIRELENVDPTTTLLNFLRYEDALTGTKEGCAEGDCGACTVVLGDLTEHGIHYQAVNACIQFLPMLDGRELITVEDLKAENGELHPVQQALVTTNATQCGFCTPGFAMSLFAEMHGKNSSELSDINNVLAGNLCRCTGYGPIIEAAKSIAGNAPADKFTARQKNTVELLQSLAKESSLSLDLSGRRYFAPKTMAELSSLLAQHPAAIILAGATDIGLWVTKQFRELETVIYVGQIEALKKICVEKDHLVIGAGVTYTQAWDLLQEHFGDFGELVRRVASTQIRNSGTIGGNIANGSPIGDTPPALIALGATLTLSSKDGSRDILLEDFFIQYGQQDLKAGEFVEKVSVPLLKNDGIFKCYKISKRFDQDISALCGAFHMQMDGTKVLDIRICYGGMAGTPARAFKTEQALIGMEWNLKSVEVAMIAMAADFTPLSDMRASQEYRMMTAQNLLKKFYAETSDPKALTRLVGQGSLSYA